MKTQYNSTKQRTFDRGFQSIVSALILLLIFSCDSFTDVDMPKSELTGPAVYQDAATAKAALADIYARLREGGVASGTLVGGTSMMANYSDDMDFYGTNTVFEQFGKHTILPSNSTLLTLWSVPYSEIYAINAVIEGIQASTAITGEDRNRLLGELIFLRAFNYFYLVNIFGDIPYVTSTDYQINAVIPKTPAVQVWQNIISDLRAAEELLPETYPTEERIRANKSTVQAMLARACLYTGNYQQAEAYASIVINNPVYVVEANPSTVFLAGNQSTIWSFHPGIAGQNTNDAVTYNFTSGPPSKPALSSSLYNSFEAGDLRKSQWIKTVVNGPNIWYRPYKYKETTSTQPSQEYTIILRLEEQYLIRAEARAISGDISGAIQDLNVTRNRAGLANTSAASTADLRTAILQERRLEFFTEQSHRWFDLKRTGNAANTLSMIKPGWQDTDILFPIPESELLLNDNLLPQNPGY